jgi:hypothetical protein
MARALILRFAGMCGMWLVIIALFHEFALGASTERMAWSYRVGLSVFCTAWILRIAESSVTRPKVAKKYT